MKQLLFDGAIPVQFVAEKVSFHQTKTNISGHNIYLGQIKHNKHNEKNLIAVEYSCYEPLLIQELTKIREVLFSKYPIFCLHFYHSMGVINVGEIYLFILISAIDREETFKACKELSALIKSELPIWGKEIYEDNFCMWKNS